MSMFEGIQPLQSRTLPVILLLDVSGSMRQDDKIDVLNDSVAEMISELTAVDDGHDFITLTVIAFGGDEAKIIQKNSPVRKVVFKPLKAAGRTPMGQAFAMACRIIEDRDEISSKAYRPTIALVSDGLPVPELQGELEQLLTSDRGSKSARFALAVGADADRSMLARFASNAQVHQASEAAEIRNFLQWVTTTVTQRTLSIFDPNLMPTSVTEESLAVLQNDDAF